MAIKWQLFDDFRDVIQGRVGGLRVPRPRGWDLAIFLAGKALFFALAFGIPVLFHSGWVVLLFYGVTGVVLGMVLSIVFQLAHTVEPAEFPMPRPGTGRIENAWAIHQTENTVDFARRSRVMAWLIGGLNFQIEHHLFPRICHVNYPAIAPLVEKTCREFGVKYTEHKSFRAGVASHYRWLRRMGLPVANGQADYAHSRGPENRMGRCARSWADIVPRDPVAGPITHSRSFLQDRVSRLTQDG